MDEIAKQNTPPFDPVDHLLPPAHPKGGKPSSVGPTVGIIIILVILIIGTIYAWITNANRPNPYDSLPLIPGDVATESAQ